MEFAEEFRNFLQFCAWAPGRDWSTFLSIRIRHLPVVFEIPLRYLEYAAVSLVKWLFNKSVKILETLGIFRCFFFGS